MSERAELVLVPGLNNTHAVFDGVVQALPGGVHAHAVDNPALETVDDIARQLLAGLPDRFWLAGFSFGGYVALAMLAAAPARVQGIALLCTTPFADSPAAAASRQAALQAVADGRYFELIESQAAKAFHPDSLADPALMAQRRRMVRDYGPERFAAHVKATRARADRADLLDGQCPTLVLSASHDALYTPAFTASWANAIAGATHTVIEGAGHLAPMEKPVAVATALGRWMGLRA